MLNQSPNLSQVVLLQLEIVQLKNLIQNFDPILLLVILGQFEALAQCKLNFKHNIDQISILFMGECKQQDLPVHLLLQDQLAHVDWKLVLTLGVVQLVPDDAAEHPNRSDDLVGLSVCVDDLEEAVDAVHADQFVHPLFLARLVLLVQDDPAGLDDHHGAQWFGADQLERLLNFVVFYCDGFYIVKQAH